MATDIGIGLARMLDILRGKAGPADRGEITTRLSLHTGTVLSFLLGGVAGVLAWRIVGDLCFVIAGLVLAAIAATSMRRAGQIVPQNDPLD